MIRFKLSTSLLFDLPTISKPNWTLLIALWSSNPPTPIWTLLCQIRVCVDHFNFGVGYGIFNQSINGLGSGWIGTCYPQCSTITCAQPTRPIANLNSWRSLGCNRQIAIFYKDKNFSKLGHLDSTKSIL